MFQLFFNSTQLPHFKTAQIAASCARRCQGTSPTIVSPPSLSLSLVWQFFRVFHSQTSCFIRSEIYILPKEFIFLQYGGFLAGNNRECNNAHSILLVNYFIKYFLENFITKCCNYSSKKHIGNFSLTLYPAGIHGS